MLLFVPAGQGRRCQALAHVLRRAAVEPRAAWREVLLKATPLIADARSGLALCFRANVWNIGAEGQLIAGAIAGGGVALLATPRRAARDRRRDRSLAGVARRHGVGGDHRAGCATASTPTRSWSA
ncbi:MAG: hypothetical protein MZW92_56575 [Comamonadaceae bacterium]|nr:hypothetical protein [Comamonadaceae bacterium]